MLKRIIRKGDILYIHSLDRFGRNKAEILQEWNDLTKNIEADIVVLDMPLLDTTQYKDSMGTFIAELVLQILSWMAEEERVGRPAVYVSEEIRGVYKKWNAKEVTTVQAMRESGVKKTSFYKLVKVLEEETTHVDYNKDNGKSDYN